MSLSDKDTTAPPSDADEVIEAFEDQRQLVGRLQTANGFSAAKMAALARKNGVQAVGAMFRQPAEPGLYIEPTAPAPLRRARTRL